MDLSLLDWSEWWHQCETSIPMHACWKVITRWLMVYPVSTNLSLLLSLLLLPSLLPAREISLPLLGACTFLPLLFPSAEGKEPINDQQIQFLLRTASSHPLSPTVHTSVINHVQIHFASSWLQVSLVESLVESFWGRGLSWPNTAIT